MPSGPDSDSSSSDGDGMETELSDAELESLLTLEQALTSNPKAYDTHVQYISALRSAKLTERLKAARRAMHEYFPMTDEMWCEWLDEEGDVCNAPHTMHLFELAVDDYVSVSVWQRYLRFVQDAHSKCAIGADDARKVNERALSAAGLHVSQGSMLWNLARDWEMAQLAELESSEEMRSSVRSLFHRQLQVPLLDGQTTLQQYHSWEASLPAPQQVQDLPLNVKTGFDRAQAAAKLRAANEAAVGAGRAADHDLLAAFSAYLRLEETAGDPLRQQEKEEHLAAIFALLVAYIAMVFERALARFPVTSHLWLQYARFAEAKLTDDAVINGIYKRATRNCPWVGALWARRLYALERSCASDKDHAAVYADGMASGLQDLLSVLIRSPSVQTSEDAFKVILSRIDFVRRQQPFSAALLRTVFKEATTTLQELLGDSHHDDVRLTTYWADCEVKQANDVDAARSVWESALQSAPARSAGPWSAYIAMERALRNLDKARSLYKRWYTCKFTDGSQSAFCEAWVQFEREEGSAAQQLQASLKVEPILNEAAATAAAAADAVNAASATAAAQRAPMPNAEEIRDMRRQKDPNYGQSKGKKAALKQNVAGSKRPAPTADEASNVAISKKARPDSSSTAQASADSKHNAAPSTTLTAVQAGSPSSKDTGSAPSAEAVAATAPTVPLVQGHEIKGAPTLRDDSMTVFVKNMNFKVTDKELWDFFSACGTVIKVAVKRDDKGNSKGFAFVHFDSKDAVESAISKDQTPLRGRPLVIQQSQPLTARSGSGRGGGRSGEDGGGGGGGGARGGTAGRGRGRGQGRGRQPGGDSRAAAGAEETEAEQFGTATQGTSSRDAGTLGRGGGPDGWASGRAGKKKLELKQPAGKAGLGFKPRALAVAHNDALEKTHPALQNKDFRNMLLGKNKPADQ